MSEQEIEAEPEHRTDAAHVKNKMVELQNPQYQEQIQQPDHQEDHQAQENGDQQESLNLSTN